MDGRGRLKPARPGRQATGLGYLSGHAGVAAALGAAALPHLGPPGRALTLTAIPVVGLTRIYVGAHLPLDVAGGAALGLAVDAAVTLVSGVARHWGAGEGLGPPARARVQADHTHPHLAYSPAVVQAGSVVLGSAEGADGDPPVSPSP